MSNPETPSTSQLHEGEDNLNARWSKKAWNHLGYLTREETVELLRDKVVSQKRRMLVKDCVRIIYYCQVQRSTNCKYEMSLCVPINHDEKVRVDECGSHSCDVEMNRNRRRVLPQLEDFDRPIEKRIRSGNQPPGSKKTEQEKQTEEEFLQEQEGKTVEENVVGIFHDLPRCSVWTQVDMEIVDLTKKPDNVYKYIVNCTDRTTRFSYAVPLTDISPVIIAHALLEMFYLFGPSEELQMELQYLTKSLADTLKNRFPALVLTTFVQKTNNMGHSIPRREAQMVKERLFAWLVENDCSRWAAELRAMKFAHNSEWIEELGGTPMDLFYRRNTKSFAEGIEAEHLMNDVKFEMCNE